MSRGPVSELEFSERGGGDALPILEQIKKMVRVRDANKLANVRNRPGRVVKQRFCPVYAYVYKIIYWTFSDKALELPGHVVFANAESAGQQIEINVLRIFLSR